MAIASANFQRNAWAAFADDTWKVTPKLTLSLGLRYELTPPWTDLLNNDFTVAMPHLDFFSNAPASDYPYFVRQGNCTDPYAGLNIRWTSTNAVCSNGACPTQLMQTAYKNFAPRIGISYSPDSKLVIRTGFGMFYNQDIGNAVFDMARNIAARVTLTSNLGTPSLFYSNAVPGGSGAIAQIPPPYAYVDAYSHKTSYTMQFLLQRAARSLAATGCSRPAIWEDKAITSMASRTPTREFRERWAARPRGYPFANFGVIQLVADGANANYNSLSVKATRRFSQGLSVISSYHLVEIDRRHQRHSRAGLRHAVPAEQQLHRMRTRAFLVRRAAAGL